MTPLLSIDLIVQLLCNVYLAVAIFLFVSCWAAIPVTALFAGFRASQLRDPQFDHRVTTPTHATLHFFCAFFFGLLLPTFYFMAVRKRWELGMWYLGSDTHSAWTIAVGVVCIGWLAAHLIEAALRLDRPRFGPSPLNRVFAGLGVGLCVWHIAHVAVALPMSPGIAEMDIPDAFWRRTAIIVIFHLYPLGCYAATLAVFGFALFETFRPQPMPDRRRWRVAAACAVAAQAALFAPFWLSIPKVSHGQAMALLETHREVIESTSEQVDLDPRLLAGIIYVAQTRDHPRLLGEPFERLGVRIWSNTVGNRMSEFDLTPVNPSAGLCQIRPTTAVQILSILQTAGLFDANRRFGKVTSAVSTVSLPWNWQRTGGQDMIYQLGAPSWRSLAQEGQATLQPMADRLSTALPTADMEALLWEPEKSTALAATMLWILREQWRVAGHSIDDRPEILATLYNIGFERSAPKAEPQANDFGRRVLAFMESDECAALFPREPGPRAEAEP